MPDLQPTARSLLVAEDCRAEEARTQRPEPPRPPVLLVDDHPTNRLLLQRQLQALGHAAEVARDGEQALALWRTGRFGAVITDCEMPRMDGYALAGAIRRIEREEGLARTPVFACTGHALPGQAQRCAQAGMDACLVKPVDLAVLHDLLDRWLPVGEDAGMRDSPHPLDLALVAATWGDDPGQVREILRFFQRANAEDVATLQAAVQARDLAAATRAAHRMVGASRMVGALDFAAACARIHGAGVARDWDALRAGIAAFDAERERLDRFILHGPGRA